jgi:hypothetical protein
MRVRALRKRLSFLSGRSPLREGKVFNLLGKDSKSRKMLEMSKL